MVKYEMSKRERGVILGIILNTRNDYLKKNKYVKIQSVSLEVIEIIDNTMDIEIEKLCNNVMFVSDFGNLFEDKNIKRIIEKALTNKQRSVLFLYYYENKKDKEIAKMLNTKTDTIRKLRNRTLEKIKKLVEEKRNEKRYI